MRGLLWRNALALTTFAAFVIFLSLQAVFGWQVRNEELTEAGRSADGFLGYLSSGHFVEAVFENWESEFLQMGAYVLLTAYLVQVGSPESKPLDGHDRAEDHPTKATTKSPRWSRRKDWRYLVYRNSLSLCLFGFFALSFLAHLLGGTAAYNEEQALRTGAPPISAVGFLGTSEFWFQSMQNWQSEFLAVGTLVVLSIVLRQHGSPQSKPVTAAHSQTGA
ncbi:MAG TPA: DUF6766 family protein [Micromonosporaceae bacterium]|nr:DUF6766 family protein [Micromonosporaceae bacterium]